MEIHRYPKQCYITLKRLDEVGKITWASHVKEMLYKYGQKNFMVTWFTNLRNLWELMIFLFNSEKS